MLTAIPCTLMRGGTSKGISFHADDLPAERPLFDQVLLAAMGSPDARQIDGLGGAHPLTSKVAVISRARRADADVDYLFLQVVVDKPEVSDSQNCGNLLAGVGPWAIENGLVAATQTTTPVRIHMVNTGSVAVDGELASEHLGITDILAITFGRDLSSPSQTFLRDQPHVRRHAEGGRCSPGYRSEA